VPAFWEGDLTLTEDDAMRLKSFIWGDATAALPSRWADDLVAVRGVDGRVISATVNQGLDTMETSFTGDGIYYRPLIPYRNQPVRITWRTIPGDDGRPIPCYGWADLQAIDRCEMYHHDEGIRAMGAAREIPFSTLPPGSYVTGVVPAPDQRMAEKRAEDLLMSMLDATQREMFRKEQAIIVIAASGIRYRIRLSMINNIEQLDTHGNPLLKLCVHPVNVPLADVLVTQKLLLETDEQEFRRMANITNVKTGRLVQQAAALPRSRQEVA
jgi:hypothetical protein